MKKLLALILALTMVFALAACGQPAAPATPTEAPAADTAAEESADDPLAGIDMKPVNWSMGVHVGSTSSYYLMEVEFAERVYERTNGLVNITVYASGELPYSPNEFARLVGDGTIEMAAAPTSYISGECPACGVVAWPMLAGGVDELDVAVAAAQPYINKELNAKGIEAIAFTSSPMQTMFGVGETPSTPDDLNGRKLRVFDAYQPELLSNYGMTCVSMVLGEVLPSMQKNTIDCALTGVIYAADSAWYDIVDWGYLLPIAASSDIVMINKDLLDSLPEPIREILLEEADNLTAANKEYAANTIDAAVKTMEDNGVDMIWPSDEDIAAMVEVAVPYYEKWASADQNTADCLAAVLAALGK